MRSSLFKRWRICVLLALCSCFILSGCRCDASKVSPEIIRSCGSATFSISEEDYETAANGTILIYEKEKDVLGVKIILFVNVDARDWGGVAFYLPVGCTLDGIVCSFLPTDTTERRDLPVELLTTESIDNEYCIAIEVGRNRNFQPLGGGTSTLIIDASYVCINEKDISALKFAIECGASQKNGNVIWGVEFDDVLVDINKAD